MELYNLEQMRNERDQIERFCKEQIHTLEQLKNQIEHSDWNDARHDELIEHMNTFSSLLAATIAVLYDAPRHKVRFFDDLTPLLDAYKNTAAAFDNI
jgi:predicted RNA-binding protein with PIN domain